MTGFFLVFLKIVKKVLTRAHLQCRLSVSARNRLAHPHTEKGFKMKIRFENATRANTITIKNLVEDFVEELENASLLDAVSQEGVVFVLDFPKVKKGYHRYSDDMRCRLDFSASLIVVNEVWERDCQVKDSRVVFRGSAPVNAGLKKIGCTTL